MGKNLNIYIGNRLETLVGQLAEVVSRPLSSVLSPETIVVQSRGMEHWVSMELARYNRISANCYFPFPNTFLEDLFHKFVPDVPDVPEAFWVDRGSLAFHIMKLLPECIETPGFDSLRNYLEGDTNGLKRYQLSAKIADIFDQYLVFRPDLIFSWEAGRETHWQARLWRKLTANNDRHRAGLRKKLIDALLHQKEKVHELPERISIFGISYLPHFHTEVFDAISSFVTVNVFLMNPCREYWADIVSHREMKRIRDSYRPGDGLENELHLESGNRLLASMGRQGRDFLSKITGYESQLFENFEEPLETSLLACLQTDILNMTEGENSAGYLRPEKADRSIQIHSCHSFMREVEVLYDNLLAMFEEDPELLPKDVIVMAPDIETYAPYLRAVFGSPEAGSIEIPYTIADRSIKNESRLVEAFLELLALKNSRFGAARVLRLLEYKVVCDKFNLKPDDIKSIVRWIGETNIRWAFDAENRGLEGVPAMKENTWQAGFERLLLGYAMSGGKNDVFAGILPYDQIGADDGLILGRFLVFMHQLNDLIRKFSNRYTLDRWKLLFDELTETIFLPDETSETEMLALHRIIDGIDMCHERADFEETVGFEVIREYFKTQIRKEVTGYGFISGGVTCCAMLPMRSIPFKAVCLIGMGTDMFPRNTIPVGFDLVAKNPRPGDRSRREDDKYLFLEALISARRRFYISYVGQDVQDNTMIPPSVIVSELTDYLCDRFDIDVEQLVTEHCLQAFSPDYFKGNRERFSYSRENFKACIRLVDGQEKTEALPRFISGPLPLNADDRVALKHIEVDELVSFFNHPTRYMLRKRLGIFLDRKTSMLAERENFAVNPLDHYRIEQDMIRHALQGNPLENMLPKFRGSGHLPHGTVGEVYFRQTSVGVESFVKRFRKIVASGVAEPLEVDLDIAGYRIDGSLKDVYPDGPVQLCYAKLKAKYILKSWIYHLIYNVKNKEINSSDSVLICKDSSWKFDSISAAWAGKKLIELLGLYVDGMTLPLKFFPESSYEFARHALGSDQPISTILDRTKRKWLGYAHGEGRDPYYELCFERTEITELFDHVFQNIAVAVFEPLLQCLKKIE